MNHSSFHLQLGCFWCGAGHSDLKDRRDGLYSVAGGLMPKPSTLIQHVTNVYQVTWNQKESSRVDCPRLQGDSLQMKSSGSEG